LFQAMPGARGVFDARSGDARAELAAAQAELRQLDERVAALAVRAHADGRLALPDAADLAGRFVRRGSLLGQVLTDDATTVRVALPESEASDLQHRQRGLSVRLAGSPQRAHAATLVRDGVGAVLQLPSAALSVRHGGGVVTDPRDRDDLTPLQPVVLLDVRLDARDGAADERIGERAWVRFDAGLAAPAWQLAQALQRFVLRRFNPQI
jgi:putative peptide zinc metalloprotease protein